ncbi:MAG: DUF58 domain-containing protein [Zoogloeaceae bacterium]|jgi:uncharacterized protein (DUF58 family)|nr:DUF58 domain-containing protein [Zoogloeaceae bacterium]
MDAMRNLAGTRTREAAGAPVVPAPGASRPRTLPPSVFRSPSSETLSSVTPTAAGVFWLLAALALLATAINYGNNLVFALAFLLFAVWLQGAWTCWRNLAGLIWQPEIPAPAFVGEMLHPGGHLRDPSGRRREQIFLAFSARGARHPGKQANLAADGARLDVALPALVRGRQHIEPLRLVSLYPLGLWRASRAVAPIPALAYPRPAGNAPLPGKAPRPAHRQQESGDFQGVRPYAPGDSPRRVNWRVYGRREELVVNNFDGGQGGHALWLDMDACKGDTETRLSQLCQWVLAAGQQGLEYGLRLPGAQGMAPGQGREHQQKCLEMLALLPAEKMTEDSSSGAKRRSMKGEPA